MADGATLSKAAGLAQVSRGAMRRKLASDPLLQLEVRVVRAQREGDTGAAVEIRDSAKQLIDSGRAVRHPRVVQIMLNTIVQQAERVVARREPKARARPSADLAGHLAQLSEEERSVFAALAET